jgi:hypothetical protein
VVVLAAGLAAAQPPANAVDPDKPEEIDNKPALPPEKPRPSPGAAAVAIRNKDRRIFRGLVDSKTGKQEGGIVDFLPVASEKENPDEYAAWTEIVLHARDLPNAELEESADRDLTWDDMTGPPRLQYRLELLRIDGKLLRVRRFPASAALARADVHEMYEAQIVPLDEPMPAEVDREKAWPYTVAAIFTELPAALASLKQQPMGEWMAADGWATSAGYLFKVKQAGPKDPMIPILIGKSISITPGIPGTKPGAEKSSNPGTITTNPTALDKNLRIFKYIKDDARIAKGDDGWEEAVAWNRVLLHARRFSLEELEASARGDLKFPDLFEPIRRDYKLQLVKFEGRLIMLRKMEPSRKLLAAGLDTAYEGWLVPVDEPRGNPICIVFTDPPPDVEPVGRVNKWVSFAGYSFKLMRYDSGERDKDDPKKHVVKKAPLLLGRGVIARPDPDAPTAVSWTAFVQITVAVILALSGTALGLTLWFRRGDRRARQEITTHRSRNPFGEANG